MELVYCTSWQRLLERDLLSVRSSQSARQSETYWLPRPAWPSAPDLEGWDLISWKSKSQPITAVCPNNNVVIGSTTHGWNEEFTKHVTASAFQTKPTIHTVALQRFDPAAVHLVHTLTCNQSVKLQRPAAGSICTRPAAVICDVN